MDSFDARIGTTLTLRRMLDGDLSLIIPDMQRDYCWDRGRVEALTAQLADLFMSGCSVTIGLLYGYEYPIGSHRLMLIDGQQRITTLYLLLGMLYRRTPEPWLRRLLISDYELSDDCQPRLVYQVRNEAMYFMSDLVTNFFLNRDGRLSLIRRSHWYFASYDSDPTVTAVLTAIQAIDDVLERASIRNGWNFSEFAKYVADKLLFIYHNLDTREQAERMFITINTTGEPLTRAQLIKTELYLHASDKEGFVEKWNAFEQWCWTHRYSSADVRHPDTGDDMQERVISLWEARCKAIGKPVAYESRALDSICGFLDLYNHLVSEVPEALDISPDRPDHLFVLLPCIEYLARWGSGVVPLWHMLSNITRYRRMNSNGSDTEMAIKLIKTMPADDIVSFLDVKGNYDRVLTPEETGKLRLLLSSGNQYREMEAIIRRGEAHPLLHGCVMGVAEWCRKKEDKSVDIAAFRHYIDRIYEIWPGDIDCNPRLDLVRRALLTLRHNAYPMARRSATSLSLAWHDYDWQRLMATAPGLIRQLIDRIGRSGSAKGAMINLCERFSDRSYEWAFLISQREVMAMCAHRMLMQPCPQFIGMHVAGSDGDTRWYVGQNLLKPDLKQFSNIHPYGSRCIYTDHRTLNLAVDIYWEPDSRHPFRLEIFSRTDDDRRLRAKCDIREIAAQAALSLNYDRTRKRHFAIFKDTRSTAHAFNRLTASKIKD